MIVEDLNVFLITFSLSANSLQTCRNSTHASSSLMQKMYMYLHAKDDITHFTDNVKLFYIAYVCVYYACVRKYTCIYMTVGMVV